jgi:hypothetical protein
MAQMKKKTKKKLIIGIVLIAILLLSALAFMFFSKKSSNGLTETPISGGSSGGTSEETDEGWSFPDFSGLFDFDFTMPCFWNCGDSPSEEVTPFVCYKHSDCYNVCSDYVLRTN